MTSKINVTDNIAIIIEKMAITVNTNLNFDMSINFDNKEKEPTLDENGDLFEPVYKCKIKAIPKPQTRPKFSKWGTYEDPKMKAWRKQCTGLIEANYDGP